MDVDRSNEVDVLLSLPVKPRSMPEYLKVADKEVSPSGLSDDCLVSGVKLLGRLINGANDYIYFDEGLSQYQRTIRLLYPWLAYGVDLAQKDHTPQDVGQYVNLTAYLLESSQVDKISGRKRGNSFIGPSDKFGMVSQYGRFYSHELNLFDSTILTDSFFLNQELAYIFEHGESDLRIRSLNELEATLWDKKPRTKDWETVFVTEPFPSLSSLRALSKRLYERAGRENREPKKLHLRLRVNLDSNVGMCVTMTSDGEYWSTLSAVSYEGSKYRLTSVPAIDMIKAYMRAGDWRNDYSRQETVSGEVKEVQSSLPSLVKSITDEKLKMEMQTAAQTLTFPDNQEPAAVFSSLVQKHKYCLEKWQADLLRKRAVQFAAFDSSSSSEQQEQLSRIIFRHREGYERLMADPENPEIIPQIFFTRSGLSANAVALFLAKQILGDDLRVSTLDGWYYESDPPETWMKAQSKEANLLLAGLEPNPPQFERDENGYLKYRDNEIHDFLSNATLHPDQQFVLIADKTVCLTDQRYLSKKNLPLNVLVIETASITKHQRGARANFYGTLAVWGNLDTSLVDTAITAVGGNLTPDAVFALPRLTRSEIERNLVKMKKLAAVFEEEFDKAQENTPPSRRWQWQHYSCYGFILPPKEILEKCGKGEKQYSWFINSSGVKSATNSFIYEHPEYLIDKGDSFGLTQTRITPFGIPYLSESQEHPMVSFLRVGFGTHTPEGQMREFARYLSKMIVEESPKHWLD